MVCLGDIITVIRTDQFFLFSTAVQVRSSTETPRQELLRHAKTTASYPESTLTLGVPSPRLTLTVRSAWGALHTTIPSILTDQFFRPPPLLRRHYRARSAVGCTPGAPQGAVGSRGGVRSERRPMGDLHHDPHCHRTPFGQCYARVNRVSPLISFFAVPRWPGGAVEHTASQVPRPEQP